MIEITLSSRMNVSAIRAVEDKLLMLSGHHRMLLITGVSFYTKEVPYGRKKKKTTTVKMLSCTMNGWNPDGEFVGTYDMETTKRYLEFELLSLRKNYIEFEKQWRAMQQKCTAVNNPLQTLEGKEDELPVDVKIEIDNCILNDKPLLAVKLYKVATNCTLVEAKEYIKSLTI